jgi:hypothetical protein
LENDWSICSIKCYSFYEIELGIEGFNNENTNINLINILKEKANFENQRLNDIKEIYKPLFKYDFKKKHLWFYWYLKKIW